MLNSELNYFPKENKKPDYDGLVRFLIEPLLESPELLSFDCELVPTTKKVWIRLAFEENDKGKIFGRGGRNIQAVKTVLRTAADMAGDTLYLEVYEDENSGRGRFEPSRSTPRQPTTPKESLSPEITSRKPIRRREMGKPVNKAQF